MHAPAAAVIDSFPKLMWDSCSRSKSEPVFFSCCERLDNLIWFWLEGRYSTWAVFKLRLLWEKYGCNYRDKSWETFLMLAFVSCMLRTMKSISEKFEKLQILKIIFRISVETLIDIQTAHVHLQGKHLVNALGFYCIIWWEQWTINKLIFMPFNL